ncbi:MAG: PilZ domain-containing protein [bacterium]
MNEQQERREFEREPIRVPFIYSMDEGGMLSDGQWFEALSDDICPGGLAFVTDKKLTVGQLLRIVLFMSLREKDEWIRENKSCSTFHNAKVIRSEVRKNEHRAVGCVVWIDWQ